MANNKQIFVDTVSEITGAAGVAVDGVLLKDGAAKLSLTQNDAAAGPILEVHRTRGAAGQDSDYIGVLRFTGKNDNATPDDVIFAEILSQITDAGDGSGGSEDGDLVLKTMRAGTLTGVVVFDSKGQTTLQLSSTGNNLLHSDVSVAHGLTDLFATDVYFATREYTNGKGGGSIWGLSDDADTPGQRVVGIIGVADPTDTVPAINLVGAKKDGTTSGPLSDAETLFRLDNNQYSRVTVLGNGYTGLNVAAPAKRLEILDASAAQLRKSYSGTVYTDELVGSDGRETKTFTGTNGGLSVSNGFFGLGAFSEKTISSGALTATNSCESISSESNTTDDLQVISGGAEGDILILVAGTGHTITVKDYVSGSDNLLMAGNFTLGGSRHDTIMFIKHGSYWKEISRSDNA